MKKRVLSLALALVLCLSLTVPALAATELYGDQLYPVGGWGEGPGLVLTGVTNEFETGIEDPYCYEVAVGGRLILDMPYPAGEGRCYLIQAFGIYVTPDYTDYAFNDSDIEWDRVQWEIPEAYRGGGYDEENGISRYVYDFSKSDMGQWNGYEQVIDFTLAWSSDVNPADFGSVEFLVHVVPNDAGHTAQVGTFTDVKPDDYFAGAVSWAVDQKITKGTSKTTFSPAETCNRAQILTFLYRAAGSPAPTAANPFADVTTDDYFYNAARWAAEQGMISGTSFDAATPCTRASTVEYIWKAAGAPKPAGGAGFDDVPADADYAEAVAWAVEQGVTSGTGKTTFSPEATCTRGQIVTFLCRAFAWE